MTLSELCQKHIARLKNPTGIREEVASLSMRQTMTEMHIEHLMAALANKKIVR